MCTWACGAGLTCGTCGAGGESAGDCPFAGAGQAAGTVATVATPRSLEVQLVVTAGLARPVVTSCVVGAAEKVPMASSWLDSLAPRPRTRRIEGYSGQRFSGGGGRRDGVRDGCSHLGLIGVCDDGGDGRGAGGIRRSRANSAIGEAGHRWIAGEPAHRINRLSVDCLYGVGQQDRAAGAQGADGNEVDVGSRAGGRGGLCAGG